MNLFFPLVSAKLLVPKDYETMFLETMLTKFEGALQNCAIKRRILCFYEQFVACVDKCGITFLG